MYIYIYIYIYCGNIVLYMMAIDYIHSQKDQKKHVCDGQRPGFSCTVSCIVSEAVASAFGLCRSWNWCEITQSASKVQG